MNGQGQLGPEDEALLGELVATLRDATPSARELAPMRDALVGPGARRGAMRTPWWKLVLAIAALGLSEPALHARRVEVHASAVSVAAFTEVSADETSSEADPAPAEPREALAEPREGFTEPGEGFTEPHEGLTEPREGFAEPHEGLTEPREGFMEPREGFMEPREGFMEPREGSMASPSGAAVDATRSSGQDARALALEVRAAEVRAPGSELAVPGPHAKSEDGTEEPSPLYASAMRAAAGHRCEEAAPLLSRIVEGETNDAPLRVEQAELTLARCLFELGYVNGAAAIADGIAQRPEASTHEPALELLARLGERLPDPRGVVGSVGHYERDVLAQVDPARRGTLSYLLGRARDDAGALEEAAALFAEVPPGHRFYVPARYLEGMSHVRDRHAVPAIAAFEAVLEATRGSAGAGSGERDRYRDLARLAIARVRYAAARPGSEGDGSERDEARRNALLEGALEAWQEVPFGSEAGLDAFFEESWALYLLGESPRALGHIHGLLAPQLRDRPHPEALVLRATILYEHCRFEAARTTVDDFHARFDPLLESLEGFASSLDETEAAYALLEEVRAERGPTGELGAVVRAALDDREIARLVVSVRAIDAESDRLAHARVELREGSLGLRLSQELALARSFAVELGGRLVRERLGRVIEALRDRSNEIDTVALEITTRTRTALERGEPLTREPERPVPIVAVQGDEVWPFDGEYWEDELPYYRELVTDLCPDR
ncbi:MAG: hypothetical protein K1X94_10135 [Sandaracinaceae bacterium]|nr:hypothetical protein [Sandaracinaceae bacterium]